MSIPRNYSGTFTSSGVGTAVACSGDFSISVEITATATVYLQRSYNGGSNWRTIEEYTSSVEKEGTAGAGMLYRLAADVTSGQVEYFIGQ